MQIPFVGFQPVLTSEHMGVNFSLNYYYHYYPLLLGVWHIWALPDRRFCSMDAIEDARGEISIGFTFHSPHDWWRSPDRANDRHFST